MSKAKKTKRQKVLKATKAKIKKLKGGRSLTEKMSSCGSSGPCGCDSRCPAIESGVTSQYGEE